MHLELVLHQFLGPGLLPWGNALCCFSASCDISAFTQGEVWFLFGPQPRSGFSGQWEFKMSLIATAWKEEWVHMEFKEAEQRATILKLGNKRRHPRFYRMYWWQLIPKGDKNRSFFFCLRNSDSLGLIILCCEGLSSESDFEQYPGSPPTRCQQHPHSRHDNQDDSGHCQRCWEAKPSPNENHQNRISGSLKESRQFPCRKQKKRRHRTWGMLMDTEAEGASTSSENRGSSSHPARGWS